MSRDSCKKIDLTLSSTVTFDFMFFCSKDNKKEFK